jgi:hypothetical protein
MMAVGANLVSWWSVPSRAARTEMTFKALPEVGRVEVPTRRNTAEDPGGGGVGRGQVVPGVGGEEAQWFVERSG